MPWEGTDPILWSAKMQNVPRDALNIFAFSIFSKVVDRTPVDTGACRQNWLVTINGETDDYNPSKKKGGRVMSNGEKAIESAKGDDAIYIQNNAPYIRMLEYGGYGKANGQGEKLKGQKFPGRGKGIKRKPKGDSPEPPKPSKITADGHSLQAPHGMVGVTMSNADSLWERALEVAKNNS